MWEYIENLAIAFSSFNLGVLYKKYILKDEDMETLDYVFIIILCILLVGLGKTVFRYYML